MAALAAAVRRSENAEAPIAEPRSSLSWCVMAEVEFPAVPE